MAWNAAGRLAYGMSEMDKDETIRAQSRVIGILFEIIERMGENSILDSEYLALVLSGENGDRMEEIRMTRKQNAEEISRLLSRLES